MEKQKLEVKDVYTYLVTTVKKGTENSIFSFPKQELITLSYPIDSRENLKRFQKDFTAYKVSKKEQDEVVIAYSFVVKEYKVYLDGKQLIYED